jgi:hypothetical protein
MQSVSLDNVQYIPSYHWAMELGPAEAEMVKESVCNFGAPVKNGRHTLRHADFQGAYVLHLALLFLIERDDY